MNPQVRNTINHVVQTVGMICSNTMSSLTSLFRVFVLSKVSAVLKAKKYTTLKKFQSCTILANGPSLKAAMEENKVRLDNADIFCVNMFAESDYFWKNKPRFYFLVDGQFFNPTIERCAKQVEFLKDAFKKVDWEMYLCISSGGVTGGVLKGLDNPNIKVIRWNTTTFEGFRWLRHFMFHHNMAMPRCQTVTNFALAAAINMKYENVYLYGADHGWTKDLRVDDDNVVCYGDRHVYNTALTELKLNYSIAHLLRQYANMFESHWVINEYALSKGVNIWNCTKGSFVDAYKRIIE